MNLIEASAKSAEFALERLAAEDLDVDAVVLEVNGVFGSLDLKWQNKEIFLNVSSNLVSET